MRTSKGAYPALSAAQGAHSFQEGSQVIELCFAALGLPKSTSPGVCICASYAPKTKETSKQIRNIAILSRSCTFLFDKGSNNRRI